MPDLYWRGRRVMRGVEGVWYYVSYVYARPPTERYQSRYGTNNGYWLHRPEGPFPDEAAHYVLPALGTRFRPLFIPALVVRMARRQPSWRRESLLMCFPLEADATLQAADKNEGGVCRAGLECPE